MDIHIPALGGIAATRVVTWSCPRLPSSDCPESFKGYLVHAIMRAGGGGLFPKDEAVGTLYEFITQATRNEALTTASRHELA